MPTSERKMIWLQGRDRELLEMLPSIWISISRCANGWKASLNGTELLSIDGETLNDAKRSLCCAVADLFEKTAQALRGEQTALICPSCGSLADDVSDECYDCMEKNA